MFHLTNILINLFPTSNIAASASSRASASDLNVASSFHPKLKLDP